MTLFPCIPGVLSSNATMMLAFMSYKDGDYVQVKGRQPDIQIHLGGIVFGGDPGGELNDRILLAGNLSQSTVCLQLSANAAPHVEPSAQYGPQTVCHKR